MCANVQRKKEMSELCVLCKMCQKACGKTPTVRRGWAHIVQHIHVGGWVEVRRCGSCIFNVVCGPLTSTVNVGDESRAMFSVGKHCVRSQIGSNSRP